MGGTELVYNLFAECRTGSGNTHSGLCIVDPGSFENVWPVARSILVAMIVKGGLTIITFGIKVPCGIFIPTLGVGACVGRVVGIAMQWLQMNYPTMKLFKGCGGDADCKRLYISAFPKLLLTCSLASGIVPGLYAMVGAAAALSGVTVRAKITLPIDQ
jgi:chloride channel 3/4/5